MIKLNQVKLTAKVLGLLLSFFIPASYANDQTVLYANGHCDNAFIENTVNNSQNLSRKAADIKILNWGLLSVTAFGATPGDSTDDTSAIQQTLIAARNCGYATYFPVGNYRISDTLNAMQLAKQNSSGKWFNQRHNANVLIGQKIYDIDGKLTNQRPRLTLSPITTDNSFDNVNQPKPLLWVWAQRVKNQGNKLAGSIAPEDEQPNISFNQIVRGIDFDLKKHAGAIGLRHAGSQGSTLEDVNVYATGSYAGFYNVPGQGGGTYKIKIVGGKYGIFATNSSRYPMIAGAAFINQENKAIYWTGDSNLTMAGFFIKTNNVPVDGILKLNKGYNDYSGAMTLVDGAIKFDNPASVAIDNSDHRNLYLHDVRFKFNGIRNSTVDLVKNVVGKGLSVSKASWTRVGEYSFTQGTGACGSDSVGLVNGITLCPADEYKTNIETEDLYSKRVEAGFDNFIDYFIKPHVWSDNFPSFESPEMTDAKAYCESNPAYQLANNVINWSDCLRYALTKDAKVTKLFLPKGLYPISKTLKIPENKHLFGIAKNLTFISVDSTWIPNPNGNTPVITTDNSTTSTTTLSSLTIERPAVNDGFTALLWKAGRDSIVRDISARNNWTREESSAFHRTYFIKDNGGGRWYGISAEWNLMVPSTLNPNYRHLLVKNTTEPLWLYAVNYERSRAVGGANLDKFRPQGEINNAENVFIFYLKGEVYNKTTSTTTINSYNPILKIQNTHNVMVFGYSGNGKPVGNSIFEISSSNCSTDNITIVNIMTLNPKRNDNYNNVTDNCGAVLSGKNPVSIVKRNNAEYFRYVPH